MATSHFLDVLAVFALFGAEGGGVAVEQPEQIALQHGTCRLALALVMQCREQVPGGNGCVGMFLAQQPLTGRQHLLELLLRPCRALGLGTVLTTNHTIAEDDIKAVLNLPPEVARMLVGVDYPHW